MARKLGSFSTHHTFIVRPPYLAKQTANIGVKVFTLQSQRHGVGRSILYGEDKGGLHRSWGEVSSSYITAI